MSWAGPVFSLGVGRRAGPGPTCSTGFSCSRWERLCRSWRGRGGGVGSRRAWRRAGRRSGLL